MSMWCSFIGRPGSRDMYVFGQYREDQVGSASELDYRACLLSVVTSDVLGLVRVGITTSEVGGQTRHNL